MEGGLALMWFRMLLWVCGLALVFSQDTTGPPATIKLLPEHKTEHHEGDSVTLDCQISIERLDDLQKVNWTKRDGIHGFNTDIKFDDPQIVNSKKPGLYSQKITIYPLQQSDQGYYQCRCKIKDKVNLTYSYETELIVNIPTDHESTGVPTNTGTRSPSVSPSNDPSTTDTTSPTVPPSEVPSTTDTTPPTVMPFIVIIIVILLITIILLFICCRYDPRCWQQLQGKLSRSSKPRQENNRRNNNSWFGYELPPTVPITTTAGATSTPPETSEQLPYILSQSSPTRQENNRNANDRWEGYEIPSAITVTSGATSTQPETSEQLQGVISQSSTPRQENNRSTNDPLEGYETPSAIKATLGTRLNTAFHNVIYSS